MKFQAFRKEKVADSPETIKGRKLLQEYVDELEKKDFINEKTCQLRMKMYY
jgi:hypothetical protein